MAARVGNPWTSAMCRTKSLARTSPGSCWCSGAKPMRARTSGPQSDGSRPNTRTSPDVGRRSPSRMPSKVVLPAPLAPSSPVTPGWTTKSAPARTVKLP